jgi:hypothetical protein
MNFKDSFEKGLTAAAEAQVLIGEIDSVFSELDRQVIEASEGKVSIFRQETYEPIESSITGIGAALASAATGLMNRKRVVGIFAKNPNVKSSAVELGTVQVHKRGYPCEIRFGSERIVCEDKKSLEKALNYLLSDVDVGKSLAKLVNLKSAE